MIHNILKKRFANHVGPSVNTVLKQNESSIFSLFKVLVSGTRAGLLNRLQLPPLLLSQFVWIHPFVCSLIAEAHFLHQLISLSGTTTPIFVFDGWCLL